MTHENLPKIVPMSALEGFSVASQDADPRGFAVIGGDGQPAGVISDIWVDRAEQLVRYYEIELTEGGRKILLPYAFANVKGKKGQVLVEVINSHHFANVPDHASAEHVTRLEEDRISAYYAGGVLYANTNRAEPLI